MTQHGTARHGTDIDNGNGNGNDNNDKAGQGKARQGKARQGKARQDKARQGTSTSSSTIWLEVRSKLLFLCKYVRNHVTKYGENVLSL
jgi:hypothetical protein